MAARQDDDRDEREPRPQRGLDPHEQEKDSYLEEEGLPDLHDARPEEEVLPPRDFPQGVSEHGTTAAEHREGETLERRVRREEPESAPPDRAPRGRLVAPESDIDERDETGEAVAFEEKADRSGLTAEEEAVHPES